MQWSLWEAALQASLWLAPWPIWVSKQSFSMKTTPWVLKAHLRAAFAIPKSLWKFFTSWAFLIGLPKKASNGAWAAPLLATTRSTTLTSSNKATLAFQNNRPSSTFNSFTLKAIWSNAFKNWVMSICAGNRASRLSSRTQISLRSLSKHQRALMTFKPIM